MPTLSGFLKTQIDSAFGAMAGAGNTNRQAFTDAVQAALLSERCDVSAEISAGQTFVSGVAQVLNYGAVSIDTDVAVSNASSNFAVTIPAAKGGRFVLSCLCTLQGSSNHDAYFLVDAFVNGSVRRRLGRTDLNTGSNGTAVGASTIIELAGGDVLQLKAQLGFAYSLEAYGITNWFSLFRIPGR